MYFTIVAISTLLLANPVRTQTMVDKAVATPEAADGSIYYVLIGNEKQLTVSLVGKKVTDATLDLLKPIDGLHARLIIGTAPVTDAGMNKLVGLRGFKNLTVANIGNGEDTLTDVGLVPLGTLTQLESLDVSSNDKLTDAGLAHLKGLIRLRMLDLDWNRLDGSGLAHLKPLVELRTIKLFNVTKMKPETAVLLKQFPKLEEINLGQSKPTDEWMTHLGEIKTLRVLRLSWAPVTDVGLARAALRPPDRRNECPAALQHIS